jgi:uncharacterized phage protein (TIGR02220 family)
MRVKIPRHGVVPILLLQEPDLTFADLRVYTVLAMFQGHNDEAYPSRDEIAKHAGLAPETVSRAVVHLIEMKWLERQQRGQNRTNIYRVLWEENDNPEVTATSLPEVTALSHQNLFGSDGAVTPEVTATSHPTVKQKPHSKTPLKSNAEITPESILSYLNEKAGKRFRTWKGTGLLERIREGYSLDDFKAVIDSRIKAWKGTEWEKYLTPETLFRPGKFDKYLNEASTPTRITKAGENRFGAVRFDPSKPSVQEHKL